MTVQLLKHPTPAPTEKLLYHKASCMFPLTKGAEFAALVDDIKARGLVHPIVLYENRILDGRDRYRACRRAGVAPRYETFNGDDPVAYVISANILRRHLTRAQIREVIAREIKRRPDLSDRQIAKTTKVDHKTVRSVRAEKERRGEFPHVATRSDTRGRMQPARKPRKKRTYDVPNTGCNYSGVREALADREARRRSMLWFNEELERMFVAGSERFQACEPDELDEEICQGVLLVQKAYAEWMRLFNAKKRG